MESLEVTWGRAARIWWSLAWRVVLVSTAAAALVAIILAVALRLAGRSDLALPVAEWVGSLMPIPVSIAVVRRVLRKDYGDFTLRLVPRLPRS